MKLAFTSQCALKFDRLYLLYSQENPEQGLATGLTNEEAIYVLVKSYRSSEISFQVQTEIAEIRKRVSVFYIQSQVLHKISIRKTN